jgi:hypothetical protein
MTKTRPILAKWLKPLAFSRSGKTGQAAAFGRRAESSMVNVANGSKVAVAAAGLALAGFSSSVDANIMRSLADNQAHIDRGNQFTLAGRAAQGLGGGVVSMRITAPGTSVAINYSGVALRSFADGSGWILGTNHPVGDLANNGFGAETITVGLSGNYIASGETRLTVTNSVALSGSGSRDPNRRDMRLYFVSSGLPQFTPMQLITIDQIAIGSYFDMAGFGQYGSPASGTLPRSGDVRGFVCRYDGGAVDAGYSPAFYRQGLTFNSDSTALLGRTAQGYSGSGVFSAGSLAGINCFGTNGSSFTGVSGFNYFDQSVIAEINQVTSVPAPGAAAMFGLAAITFSARGFGGRRRA